MSLKKVTGLALMLGLFCFWGSVSFADNHATQKPELLLLKTYQTDQEVTGWVMSEKLDGVRAYWNGKQLMSRQGNVFNVPVWFIEGFPPFELDGELWLGRQRFEETMSVVRQSSPDERWQAITYNIFEVPNQKGGLLDRLSILQDYLDKHPNHFIRIISQTSVTSNSALKTELERITNLGGEGLVLRDPSALYQTGRVKTALKVKQKQDAECIVKGYTEGQGKYQGKVGAIICELLPQQLKRLFPKLATASGSSANRIIKIGSGLSDVQREHPPKVGSLITFQYMGLTNSGLPRFPVFLRVRQSVP